MNFNFWENVKIIMKEKGITQNDLASYFRVSLRTVQNWFYRNSKPEVDTGLIIADFLGTDVEFLCRGEHAVPKELNETDKTFFQNYQSLNDKEKEMVISLVNQLKQLH